MVWILLWKTSITFKEAAFSAANLTKDQYLTNTHSCHKLLTPSFEGAYALFPVPTSLIRLWNITVKLAKSDNEIRGHLLERKNKSAEVEQSITDTLKEGGCFGKCHKSDAHVNLVDECHKPTRNNRKAIIPGTAGTLPSKYYSERAQKTGINSVITPRVRPHHSQHLLLHYSKLLSAPSCFPILHS